jgi:hypothetical protein
MEKLSPEQEAELDTLVRDLGEIITTGIDVLDEEVFLNIMTTIQTFGRSITRVGEKEHILERQQLLRDKKVQEY